MNCSAVKKDGTPCKAQAKRDGLCIGHMKQGQAEGKAPATVVGQPAKLKGLPRARNLRVGLRCITMVRPLCDECQDQPEVAADWYLNCPHDPYVGKRQKTTQVPIYSEPLEDGSVVLERMEDRISWEVWPHFVEVALNPQINSGQGVERGRRKGYLLPEEVRSPAYPNGIAPMCQFRNCRWQEGLKETRWGVFCREIEAKMVGAQATDAEGNLIYGALEISHQGKRQAQLEKVAI